jgi:hypothetical protein
MDILVLLRFLSEAINNVPVEVKIGVENFCAFVLHIEFSSSLTFMLGDKRHVSLKKND